MDGAASHKILVIEDEPDVVDLLVRQLRKAGGFTAISESDGEAGIARARDDSPALIILDLMLPKMSGLEVCRILKSDPATRQIPVIMLTAKAEEVDRIVGLEFGADDYVAKPFSPREVVLRGRAILRRSSAGTPEKKLAAKDIVIDSERHEVRIAGKAIDLTAIEFKLLLTLLQRRGRVQARDRLLNDVWGYESLIDTRTVDTHVRRLREKLGKRGDVIVNGARLWLPFPGRIASMIWVLAGVLVAILGWLAFSFYRKWCGRGGSWSNWSTMWGMRACRRLFWWTVILRPSDGARTRRRLHPSTRARRSRG